MNNRVCESQAGDLSKAIFDDGGPPTVAAVGVFWVVLQFGCMSPSVSPKWAPKLGTKKSNTVVTTIGNLFSLKTYYSVRSPSGLCLRDAGWPM